MDIANQPSPQELALGTTVKVRLNDRNRTPHTGTIIQAVWHFKDAKWHYYLDENGRKVSKRYAADDLDMIAPPPTESGS
jgi:hypothetical protein